MYYMGTGGIDIIFLLMFLVIIGMFVMNIVKGLGTWNKNNNSPLLTVEAKVITKRTNVSHHRHANAGDMTEAQRYHTLTSTTYYVTFEVESGDRIEFLVSGTESGLLVEGDCGKLTFQGTRYKGFERQK